MNVVSARIDRKLSDALSLSDTARAGFYWYELIVTAPHYGNATCYPAGSAPFAGAPVCAGAAGEKPVSVENPLYPVAGMPLADIFIQRDRPSSKGTVQTLMNETDLNAKFATGPLTHALVTGVELDRDRRVRPRDAKDRVPDPGRATVLRR